jgi:hypothetical protein
LIENQTVKVGQVWKDRDWRMNNRRIKVERVDEKYAYCSAVSYPSGRTIRIRLDRFKATSQGYDLIEEGGKS